MSDKRGIRSLIGSLPWIDMLNTGFGGVSSVARMIGDPTWELVAHRDLYRMDPKKLEELQVKAIKYSFKHHYDNCDFYRNYCKDSGDVRPEDIGNDVNDIINKIPQIPVETFKQGVISSIPKERIKTVVTTSGTSGSVSYLVRDFNSLFQLGTTVAQYIIKVAAPYIIEEWGWSGKAEVIKYALTNWCLGLFMPEPQESSTWLTNGFASVIPYAKLVGIPMDFYLKGFEFDPKKILETIKERNKDNKMMLFLGFHYVYNELMKYMDETGEYLNLDPNSENLCVLLTGGGWKKLSGEAIDREAFNKKLSEYFGIDERLIVDIYGFGESGLISVDLCPNKKMHIATPAILPVTRDPYTLEVQDYGEEGLISVWDPTVHSFPSFVISDDVVKLSEPFECDGCGMVGQAIEFVGRAPKAELRSCGLKTQQILGDEDKKDLEIMRAKTLRAGIGL